MATIRLSNQDRSASRREVLDIIYSNILESPGKFNSAVRRALNEGRLDQSLMDRLGELSNLDEVITNRITHIISSKEFMEELDDAIRSRIVNMLNSDSADDLLRSVAIIIINSKGFQDMIMDNYCDNISEVTNKLLYTLINNDETLTKNMVDIRGEIDDLISEINDLNKQISLLQIENHKTRDKLLICSNDITVNDLGIELTNQEILRIDNRIVELKEELQKANLKLDRLQNVMHENDGDISILDTHIETLEKKIDTTHVEMRGDIDDLCNSTETQAAKLNEIYTELTQTSEKHEEFQKGYLKDQNDMYDIINDIYKQLEQLNRKDKIVNDRISANEDNAEYTYKTLSNLASEIEKRNQEIMDMFDGVFRFHQASDYLNGIYQRFKNFFGLGMIDVGLSEILVVIFCLIFLIFS